MIKGVNKKIIEINNPDSIYFEKAVFYLKPNVSVLSEELTGREISRCISDILPEHSKPRYKLRIGRIVIALCALVTAAALIYTFIH